jgi:hypothetical protein
MRLIPSGKRRTLKVDQQTHTDAAQSHIGEQLRFVDRVENVYGFHFDHDSVLDHQINSISDFEFLAVIHNWLGHFRCYCETPSS